MKKFLLTIICLLLVVQMGLYAQTPAFPGAEGGGMYTTGGRGGKVLYVTTLEDRASNPPQGSLRWAINQSGPRIIMFKVSGTIELKSRLNIRNGDLTIAGQSAPGDGICLRDYSLVVQADNVIIRFIRCRMGDLTGAEDDAMWGRNQKNIIIDHCTMSWATDECASFYDNEFFTLQWCIVAESLNQSLHEKGTHGYGAIWGGKNATFHHNLIAYHNSRNPRFCGSRYSGDPATELVDFRNNVIYNWGNNSSYAGEGGRYNMVNNYYKAGPATASSVRSRIFEPYSDDGSNNQPKGTCGIYYINGNYVAGNGAVTNDNWEGVAINSNLTKNAPGVTKEEIKSDVEFNIFPVVTHTARGAFDKVLDYAGCSLVRDELDIRYANETRNGTSSTIGSNGSTGGLIDSQNDAGGWPVLNSLTAPTDSDGDGIPDGWLEANGYSGVSATDVNEEGYTYLEVYLNSLVSRITAGQQSDEDDYVELFCGSVPTEEGAGVPEELLSLITDGSFSFAGERNDGCTEDGYTWRTSDVTFILPAYSEFSANFTSNGGRKIYVTINGDEANRYQYQLGSTSCEDVSFRVGGNETNTLRIRSYNNSDELSQFSLTDLCIKATNITSIEKEKDIDTFAFYDNTIYAEAKTIQVYSVSGQLVTTGSNISELYVGDLIKGIYMVRLINKNNTVSSQKIVLR